ncbi:MAG TPA: hypothetical protein VNX68_07985 [Nitrosopumilaceae archaeon]|jgi:hypothetical protein|nr:hypothetical protein [Nitrosopumilaceae archaeon]
MRTIKVVIVIGTSLPNLKPAYCFALDYETKEPIMINTWCSMTKCEECIPDWWMAI